MLSSMVGCQESTMQEWVVGSCSVPGLSPLMLSRQPPSYQAEAAPAAERVRKRAKAESMLSSVVGCQESRGMASALTRAPAAPNAEAVAICTCRQRWQSSDLCSSAATGFHLQVYGQHAHQRPRSLNYCGSLHLLTELARLRCQAHSAVQMNPPDVSPICQPSSSGHSHK